MSAYYVGLGHHSLSLFLRSGGVSHSHCDCQQIHTSSTDWELAHVNMYSFRISGVAVLLWFPNKIFIPN